MNVLDDLIIKNRDHIMSIAIRYGVTQIKVYGSALARTEISESNINFLAFFDPSKKYKWDATFRLQENLEEFFQRRVYIVDARNIPDVFYPAIGSDPVDIMQLEAGKEYRITPKTSKMYFIMLDRLLTEYYSTKSNKLTPTPNGFTLEPVDLDPKDIPYSQNHIALLAEKLSWWFSRLLRFQDNDLRTYKGFDFVEVLCICKKLWQRDVEVEIVDGQEIYKLKDYSPDDIQRFKELLPAIKEYVTSRLSSYQG